MSTTEDRQDLVVYELGYLVLPSLPQDKLEETVSNLKKVINSAGCKDFDGEEPFKIDLAYAMSKTVGASKYVVRDAYIGWMKFEAEPNQVPGIETKIRSMDEVLRFLLIKAPRETTFTFAKAKEAMMKPEVAPEPEVEAVSPEPAPAEPKAEPVAQSEE